MCVWVVGVVLVGLVCLAVTGRGGGGGVGRVFWLICLCVTCRGGGGGVGGALWLVEIWFESGRW